MAGSLRYVEVMADLTKLDTPRLQTLQTRGGWRSVEWPTMLVGIGCYGGFTSVALAADNLGPWIAALILVPLLTLHSSLQHEVIHGHPFRRQWCNELLVFVPIGLFIPFERYRDTHRAHHYDPSLTDPYDDPESNYLDPERWLQMSPIRQQIYRWNNTLAGRMVFGPAIALADMYGSDAKSIWRGERAVMRAYVLHALGLVIVVGGFAMATALPWSLYLICAYLAVSLLKVRTFLEHCAQTPVAHRTAIVEDRGPLSVLFLKNNLHAVHHAHPGVAWYQLEQVYRARRSEYVSENNGFMYRSYWEIFRTHLFTAKDPVPHPFLGRQLKADGYASTHRSVIAAGE